MIAHVLVGTDQGVVPVQMAPFGLVRLSKGTAVGELGLLNGGISVIGPLMEKQEEDLMGVTHDEEARECRKLE